MPKIRILHIIKSLGRGGAEMLLPETLALHNQALFEFHYIYFLPWKDQMVQELKSNGGTVFCFSAKNNLELIARYRKVIHYCKENEIDVIHCHLPWAGFLGRLVYKFTGIPVLYSEHNMQERYHPVTKYLNKISFNFQTLAFGVSNDVTHSIQKNIHPQISVETLLNGVNTKKFKNTGVFRIKDALEIPENAIVIGNVAVFRFQKRLVEWLQVFDQIQKDNPDVYGIIVGAGPLEEEIKEEIIKLKLEQKVFLPGLITDVKPYFEAMDIFMMSSSFEGLPIALLEAMSMECAIVTTDAGGIKEVIRNKKDGLIVPVDKWRDLAKACSHLIQDAEALENFKEAARKRVQYSFSLEIMVKELEKYYISTVESKGIGAGYGSSISNLKMKNGN